MSMAVSHCAPSGENAYGPMLSDAVILALEAEIALLPAEKAASTRRFVESERRLGLNSSKCGKLRSSSLPLPKVRDGLQKPPTVSSLRGSSGRKTGGQMGYPGKTLRRTETRDVWINHDPDACGTCGCCQRKVWPC